MIPKFFSDFSVVVAPALGNHVWQSTLFACAIAVLTLAFRKHRAHVRYALWLAASLKFLVPFSLLMAVGTQLASPRLSAPPAPQLYVAMQQASEPFAQPIVASTASSAISASPIHLLPILLVLWLCGVAAVLIIWFVRWRRVRVCVREAAPLPEGREIQTLRRLERIGKIAKPVDLLLSRTSLEPGVFGITKPVLVWPQGISDRLTDAHLESVLAHELWHVRRRDNLVAALHMLVEALFWFHPFVWWIGARLLDERERACDEEVLDSGTDRQAYAESILKICEFCVGSPLPCVSGVTSADLKKRITHIMSEHLARRLNLSRKLLLIAAVLLALAAPIAAGIFHAAPSPTAGQLKNTTDTMHAFATVSIAPSKPGANRAALWFGPNEFGSKNAPLQQVIRAAYDLEDDRIVGAPDWLSSEKYDLQAKGDTSATNDSRKLSFVQQVSWDKRMLQAVLADRLKLNLHRETRDLSVYALVIAEGAPKLQEYIPGEASANGLKGQEGDARPGIHVENADMVARGVPVTALLFHLSRQLHRTILDETGLSGKYDFMLKLPDSIPLGIDNPLPPESYESDLSAALDQQLGLKLVPSTARMEVLVIDHVEKPSEN